MKLWYRESINTKTFKEGLRKANLFKLHMILVTFAKELKEGEKVKSKITVVKKEIERRMKSARNNNSRGQRKIG